MILKYLELDIGLVLKIEFESLNGELQIESIEIDDGTLKDLLLWLEVTGGHESLISTLETKLEEELVNDSENVGEYFDQEN